MKRVKLKQIHFSNGSFTTYHKLKKIREGDEKLILNYNFTSSYIYSKYYNNKREGIVISILLHKQ